MKNIIRSLIALTIIVGFSSCEDEQDLKYSSPQGAFKILSPLSGESVALSPESPQNPGLVLTWQDMNYGTPMEVTYAVQVDVAGNEFANPMTVATTTNTYISISSATLNGAALGVGLAPFVQGGLEVRIMSTVGSDGMQAAYSDSISYLVTAYSTDLPKLYVIGNFLDVSGYGSDWTTATTLPALSASAFGATDFEGYVFMNRADAEYKFLPTNTSFDGDYGDTGASNGAYSGTIEQSDEVNAGLPEPKTAGYYQVKVDTGLLTYSMTLTEWGIIGNATAGGWDNSTPMTYDPATKKWTILAVLSPQTAPDNGWKFRANNAWTLNLGDTTENSTDGKLSYDGKNIGVATAGTYLITLDLSNPRAYTYTIVLQ